MPKQIGKLTLYELAEISEKIGCHINTLRKYLRDGRIKGRKVGNRWFVSEEGLREFFYPSGDVAQEDDDGFELFLDTPTITTAKNS